MIKALLCVVLMSALAVSALAQSPTPARPAKTTVTLLSAERAKTIGLAQSMLVITCGEDWPGAAFISQAVPDSVSVSVVNNCNTGFVLLSALADVADLEVLIVPASNVIAPPVQRIP